MSASAKTICGLLPPSSRVTGTAFCAAAAWTSAPVATEPVNDTWSTPGWPASAAPASSPRPVTTLSAPGGRPGFLGDPGERQHRQASLLGRLQDAGIAHRQGGADAAADDLHRVVPGHDVAGHAVRLAQGERGVAGGERQGFAVHLVGGAAVELAVAGQGDGVGARLLERLADVVRLQAGEPLDLLEHLAADRREDAAALERAETPPRRRAGAAAAISGGARRGDRRVDVGGAAAPDPGELAAVRRILERERLAAGGRAPGPADQEAVGREMHRGFDRGVHRGLSCGRAGGFAPS